MYVLLEEVASEIDDAASEASSSNSCLLTAEEDFLPIRKIITIIILLNIL